MQADEETARNILDVLVNHFMLRPGDVQLRDVFLRVWQGRGEDEERFGPGLAAALERGWVAPAGSGGDFALTQEGFDEA